jgi:hypothetical protein
VKASLRSATRTRRREAVSLCFDAGPIIHCGQNALLTAEVPLGRLDRDVSEQDWICSSSPPAAWHSRAHVLRSCGASLSMLALRACSRTTCQTAFSVKQSPHALPHLYTRRNSLPAFRLAA